MPIVTSFRFNQIHDDQNISRLALRKVDLLGPLRSFVGHNHTRTWSGTGFNLIWRPHDKSGPNTQDCFLELDITKETLSFTDITGPQGIANRGLLQGDIALGGLAYQQEVSDVGRKPSKPLHFEPGVWLNVPSTTNPSEPDTVARMGSIPHGTTINAQGKAFMSPTGQPKFTPASIMPFSIGSDDDGSTGIVPFNEGKTTLATALPARSPASEVPGLTDAHFQDPSTILSDFVKSQHIVSTMVYEISTNIARHPLPAIRRARIPGTPRRAGESATSDSSWGRPGDPTPTRLR